MRPIHHEWQLACYLWFCVGVKRLQNAAYIEQQKRRIEQLDGELRVRSLSALKFTIDMMRDERRGMAYAAQRATSYALRVAGARRSSLYAEQVGARFSLDDLDDQQCVEGDAGECRRCGAYRNLCVHCNRCEVCTEQRGCWL